MPFIRLQCKWQQVKSNSHSTEHTRCSLLFEFVDSVFEVFVHQVFIRLAHVHVVTAFAAAAAAAAAAATKAAWRSPWCCCGAVTVLAKVATDTQFVSAQHEQCNANANANIVMSNDQMSNANAQCPLSNAPCPTPNVQCSNVNVKGQCQCQSVCQVIKCPKLKALCPTTLNAPM